MYERSRWTGAGRHLFLMDQRLILTKEKDADGLYVYKDSLKGVPTAVPGVSVVSFILSVVSMVSVVSLVSVVSAVSRVSSVSPVSSK